MGKTVTYGIEYARTDPALEGFKFYMNRYKSLVNNSKPLLAFETILELTEWLVDESDDEVGDSPKFNSCLQGAITMCRQCLKSIQPPEFLPRAYAALSQAHLLLHDFQAAIEYGLKTIEHPLDKQLLQTAYRTMGNIYFTKSSDPEKSRFSDFSNALHYYQLERSVIDQMKDDEEDKVKQRLIQSSYFNMGVMQSKLSDHHSESEGNLRMAIQMAQQLNDAVSERTAWWELSNLFKRSGHYELVKECQENEYQLIQQHGFTDDALYCFEEQIKLHLFLEEYNTCAQLYKEAAVDRSEYHKYYKDRLEMVKKLKLMKEEIDRLSYRRDQNAPIASMYFEYIETLRDYELHRMVVKALNEDGLNTLLNARDFDHLNYAQLLHYKTLSQWELKEASKEDYLKSSNEAFEYVETNLMINPLDQLSLIIDIFKLRVRIHEYYDQQLQMDSCKKLLLETIKEEKLVRQKLENNYFVDRDIPEYTRITPSIHKALKMKIKVKIVFLKRDPIELRIHYERAPETVQKLMEDISARCWSQYGIEPILSHLRTMDHDIFPEDYVRNIITKEDQYIEAFAKDIVKKQPLHIYLNACNRLKIEPVKEIKFRLSKQTLTNISLTGLNISSNQMISLQQVIQHSRLLQTLKLSSNMLHNEDLKILLEQANYETLGELLLSNNLLTSQCIDLLRLFRLRSIDLSHNPIGPTFLKQLPELLMGIPSLKYINLENTEIGKYTCIEEETKQAYDQFQSHKMSAANLFINLSNNHFENDMLIQWTWLWKKLKRLSKLEIASVTSDFGWENFEALSDLPTLSDLSFKYSIRETLNNCRLYEFFKLKPRLNQLDLTACGLALDDMVTLSYSLEFVSKMRRLTLNSNPKIGDQGVKLLNNVIEKRKIDILDISDCQLVHLSIYLKWTGYLKQINMTKNPKLSFATREEEMAIENQLCNSHLDTLMAMIKLDNHLKLNLSSKIQSMISLSYQPSLGHLAVNSPFDDDDE